MVTQLKNILTFVICIIETKTPPRLWLRGWQGSKIAHQQQIHKDVWRLKKEGKIYEDKNGFLWTKKNRG